VSTSVALLLWQPLSFGQQKWLTDEECRAMAAATVHAVYPENCYSTYRKETLESWVLSERRDKLVGHEVNRSVYMYEVVTDVCEYVVEENGQPALRSEAHTHEPHYGIVAVDRRTGRVYWFGSNSKPALVFKQFAQDEGLPKDKNQPLLFVSLYRELVWGTNDANEVTGLSQLRGLVEKNFQSAYSPYERDEKWEAKFLIWWQKFRSRMSHLRLETTTESTAEGFLVHGFSFSGFELTIPRSDPPPKGTPKLSKWSLLVRADGTVEERLPATVYSAK
jgi:hypothetical protein